MFRKFDKSHEKGFTLIELMVVIAILALLGGVVAPQVMNKLKEAKPQKAGIDLERIGMALDMYAVQNGDYPTTEQGLDALLRQPTSQPEPLNWNGPYVKAGTKFLDPWNNEYVYESPSTHEGYDYDLYSYGPDKQEGGEDDITNWSEDEDY
jgi:general secretion pathway protein G